MRALLDTHILIWWFEADSPLSRDQRRLLSKSQRENPMVVSDISLWEVATLLELGRIELALPLRDWLEKATAPPLVRRFGITPAVAAEVAALPGDFHRDPADRILVSTARVLNVPLCTSDNRIIESGLVKTIH